MQGTTARCRRCEARTEAVCNQDGNDTASVDLRICVCMRCAGSSGERRNRNADAVFSILRLLRIEAGGLARPASSKPVMRNTGTGSSRGHSFQMLVFMAVKIDTNLSVYTRVSSVDLFHFTLSWGLLMIRVRTPRTARRDVSE